MKKKQEKTPAADAPVKAAAEAPKTEKVYSVLIKGDAGNGLELTTKTRKWARGCFELMQENGITCEVSYLAKPKPVKFKGH